MPNLTVRDSKTGKVNTIQWYKNRPPTREEILDEIALQGGSKMRVGGDIDPNLSRPMTTPNLGKPSIFAEKPMTQSTAPVYHGTEPPPKPVGKFTEVMDTLWGGEHSRLPPIRGITRPALPELSPEARAASAKMPFGVGGPLNLSGSQANWVYDNMIRPSSSLVGAASDFATGKVVGPVVRPIFNKARSIFGTTVRKAAEEGVEASIPTTASSGSRLLPERTGAPPPRFVAGEEGLVVDTTRPVTPLSARPFDPRSVRGPSGTVNPDTGRVIPAREGGKFVKRPPEPVPTVKTSELPVVDIPPEIQAAYPPSRIPQVDLPPSKLKKSAPGYESARNRTAREVADFDARTRVNPPTDSTVRSGPVTTERVGAPAARRYGETRAAYQERVRGERMSGSTPAAREARLAGKDPVSRAANEVLEEADLGSPRAKRVADDLRSVGSGRSAGATPANEGIGALIKPGSLMDKIIPMRLRNQRGELNAKYLLDRLFQEKGAASRLPKGAHPRVDPRDPSIILEQALTPEEIAKAKKLGGEGWRQKVSAFMSDEAGSARLPKMGAAGPPVAPPGKAPITLAKPSIFTKQGRQRIVAETVDAANVPRAVMASVDLSAPLRQGATMIHKKEFWKALPDMIRSVGSEKAFHDLQATIARSPRYVEARKAKLALTDLGNASGREELFMSKLAERIPGLGRVIRASGRGYVGFLNKLRMDSFEALMETAQKSGAKTSSKEVADFINAATGRANLGKLERYAPALNAAFFSPRLMASRVKMMNPVTYATASPMVRKEYIKSMAALGTAWGTIAGLAATAGADVEIDPRSSDFGKIKIGRVRLDIGAGFQQYMRTAAQLVSGERKDLRTGKVIELGKGFHGKTRKDVLQEFLEAKASPIASFILTNLEGRTFTGEKLQNLPDSKEVKKMRKELERGRYEKGLARGLDQLSKSEITRRLMPMIVTDLRELYKEDPELMWMAIPATFGATVQVHKKGR